MVFAIIIAMIIAIIYMIRTYVKTFNKTKKLGSDYIEYISPDDENVRADKDVSKVKTKEPREVRSVRKLYKKYILKGTGGKPLMKQFCQVFLQLKILRLTVNFQKK